MRKQEIENKNQCISMVVAALVVSSLFGFTGCNSKVKLKNYPNTQQYRDATKAMTRFEKQYYTTEVIKLQNYAKQTVTDAQFANIKKQWFAALNQWKNNGDILAEGHLQYGYQPSRFVIMNAKKDKLLLLSWVIYPDVKMGRVKLISARKRDDGTWRFFYTGRPNYVYRYIEQIRHGEPYTKNELINRALYRLAQDGLLKRGEINQRYFYHWVNDKPIAKGLH